MKKQAIVIIITIILVAGAFGIYTVYTVLSSNQAYSEKLDVFSKCLGGKNATMYGAYWCTHCQNQKAMFGGAFKNINYVECTQAQDACLSAGVTGFPTWVINGKMLVGEQTLQRLSAASGCEWSG